MTIFMFTDYLKIKDGFKEKQKSTMMQNLVEHVLRKRHQQMVE